MEANTVDGNVESVTMSDILNLSSWDRPRTSDELISFIARREVAIDGADED